MSGESDNTIFGTMYEKYNECLKNDICLFFLVIDIDERSYCSAPALLVAPLHFQVASYCSAPALLVAAAVTPLYISQL